jgi:hypothetical protein
MEKLHIIDGPSTGDLDAIINFDDRSRVENFNTEKGWRSIYIQTMEINPEQELDVKIENAKCIIEYNSNKKTGIFTLL